MEKLELEKPCYIRNCKQAEITMAENDRGFCCGNVKKPYKTLPSEDSIRLCLVDSSGIDMLFISPSEALSIATLLTHAWENWRKNIEK